MIGFNKKGACLVDACGLPLNRRRAVHHHASAFEQVALPPSLQPSTHTISVYLLEAVCQLVEDTCSQQVTVNRPADRRAQVRPGLLDDL